MSSLLALPFQFFGTCCGTCASYCACKTLTSSCELSITVSRFMYLGFLFIVTFLSILFHQNKNPIEIHVDWLNIHYDQVICDTHCIGEQIVYRFSLAILLFFINMAFFTSTISSFSTNIQQKYWFMKLLVLFTFMSTSIYLPDNIIDIYMILCRYASVLFLLIQMCIFIDFGYTFNDTLLSYENTLSKVVILITCLLLNIFSTYLCFVVYSNVTYGILLMSSNILVTLLSISPFAPHGTLFTSSLVTFQLSYIYTLGIKSTTHLLDNSLFSWCLTALSLMYTAYTTTQTNVFHYSQLDKANELELLDSKIIMDMEGQIILPKEKAKNKVVSGFFHITLALCSMYMPLLLLSFGNNVNSIHDEILFTQIFGFLLYIWTLIAPPLFPNRDFS